MTGVVGRLGLYLICAMVLCFRGKGLGVFVQNMVGFFPNTVGKCPKYSIGNCSQHIYILDIYATYHILDIYLIYYAGIQEDPMIQT